jgi:hypothetical protein
VTGRMNGRFAAAAQLVAFQRVVEEIFLLLSYNSYSLGGGLLTRQTRTRGYW